LAAGRATRCWIAGDLAAVSAAVDLAWPTLVRHPDPLGAGLLGWWLAVAGDRRELPASPTEPFAAMLSAAWTDAAASWLDLGCPFWAALALGRSPDIDDARQAVALLDAAGATAVRDAVLRDRHTAGLPVPRGPAAARQNNPAGLTAREMEVLTLLVEGLSNADIARRLFLSEKTVGHHVSAVLRKLGEPTRALAAAAAVRTGLVTPG
jgi:DNA-binding CsgD family transcriptional regulator